MTSSSLPALHFYLKPCPLPTTPRQNLLPLPLTWSPPNPVCLQSGICDLSFAVYGRSLWGLFSLPMSRSCPGEITCRATVPCTPSPTDPSSSTPPLPLTRLCCERCLAPAALWTNSNECKVSTLHHVKPGLTQSPPQKAYALEEDDNSAAHLGFPTRK